MTENPKDYRIRIYLPDGHEEKLPHLMDIRPSRMAIQYKFLEDEVQTEHLDYYGLWVQRNVYRTVVNGEYQDLVTRGDYHYTWGENNLPDLQELKVYYILRDESLDPKPELYPRNLIQPKEKNRILAERRSNIRDKMTSRAIALGIGQYSIPFFKKYNLLMSNYINSGDTELIEMLKSPNTIAESPWLLGLVPDPTILPALTNEQKDFIEANENAEFLSIKQVLLLNFNMALQIPTNKEIELFLKQEALKKII